jgi:hypothetical protein
VVTGYQAKYGGLCGLPQLFLKTIFGSKQWYNYRIRELNADLVQAKRS